jgi:hypothetical protein
MSLMKEAEVGRARPYIDPSSLQSILLQPQGSFDSTAKHLLGKRAGASVFARNFGLCRGTFSLLWDGLRARSELVFDLLEGDARCAFSQSRETEF